MTLRYRSPTTEGAPPVGAIMMGDGPRVRRAYRVLGAVRSAGGIAALGFTHWRVTVEPMIADRGREEINAGSPWWGLKWDKRRRRRGSGHA